MISVRFRNCAGTGMCLLKKQSGAKTSIAIALLVLALYFGVGVFDHSIWSPTEPAVSGVVWSMFGQDSLAAPRINGYPYLEKPPLYYWLAWIACKAGGGLSAGGMRLPAAVSGVLCLLLVYWTSRNHYGNGVACVTLLLGATTYQLYQMSHLASADILVVFFVFLCFTLFAGTLTHRAKDPDKGTFRYDLLLALALSISFYAKNFFTYLLVLPPIVLFLLVKRQFFRLITITTMVTALTAMILLPWILALHHEGGWEYLRVVFVDNTLGRFLTISDVDRPPLGPLNDAYIVEKEASPFFYLPRLLGLPAPWSLLFFGSLLAVFRKKGPGDFRLFLKAALISIVVVLSLSSSKSSNYLHPILFVMLLIMSDSLCDLFRDPGAAPSWQRALYLANIFLVGLALAALPFAMWFMLGSIVYFIVLLPFPFLLAAFILHGKRRWFEWRFLCGFGAIFAIAFMITLKLLLPYLEERKSYSFFFQEIREEAAGRELYTLFLDDRRLPLITYYLDRRIPVITNMERIFKMLESKDRIGCILPPDVYHTWKDRFDEIPHIFHTASKGKPSFAFVGNR